MKFTQPCFIRKNTPELREKLKALGYKPFGVIEHGFGLSTDEKLCEFESFDDQGLSNILKCCEPMYIESIDCGDNEELFLAIAALRTDSPDYQWFLWEHNDGEYHPELEESWKQYIPGEHWQEWWWFEVKKATVQQLIDKFTK